MTPDWLVDRPKVQFDLLREAEKEYVKNTGDKIEYWQRRMLARFTRNLASINGDLMAGVFDLTVAARSVVDDNYALRSLADGQSLSGAKARQRSDGNRESVERGNLAQHQKAAAAPPSAASQAAPGAARSEGAQEGKVRGRVGAANRRHRPFVPIRPKTWSSRITAVS